jgi:hypothetical protein
VHEQHILGLRRTRIKLDSLDLTPGPYAMSFGFCLNPLCESIKAVGLVNPPCIGKDEEGRIEIICGYRRLLALKQMGWPEVSCEDLSSALPSPQERLVFALHENLASRAFNPIEKAMILRRLNLLYPKQALLKRFMPLLSLPSHEATLQFYVDLGGMSRNFMEAVAGGRLSLNAARALMARNQECAEGVLQFISKITLNFNQQIQFFDLMTDISAAEGKGFRRILAEKPLQTILGNSDLNKPQKAKKILEHLKARRQPRWSAAERQFRQKIERLALPEGVKIDHPPYFEAPGYRLEVHFRDGEDLIKKLNDLSLAPYLNEFNDHLADDDRETPH